ncbi:MAG: retropepsin-like aspartic protease [Cyanobacteria bacterium]|nr:retropepsin-like aspartic protease [Cyanobacteriota bacterium]
MQRIYRGCALNAALGMTIALVGVMGATSQATAQSCYMVTASGKKTSLGPLCGEMPSESTGATSAITAKNGVYRVPIKRRLASTPVIDVMFNGKKFEMILDTGASSTLITQRMAIALGLKPTGARQMIIADGSRVRFLTANIGSVTTGGMPARKLTVTVAPNSDIGLLGHDFFDRYDVKIKRSVIEFAPPTE